MSDAEQKLKFPSIKSPQMKSNQMLAKEWLSIKHAVSPKVIKKAGYDMTGRSYLDSIKLSNG